VPRRDRDVHLEYPYRAKPLMMIAGILLFGSCAAGMGLEALTNERGLTWNGIVHLGVDGATGFYWSVAAVSAIFVVGAFVALVSSLAHPMAVTLTSREISAPRNGFSRRRITIPLPDIVDVRLQKVQRQRFLNIYHRNGRLSIVQSMLPDAAAFEKLHAALLASLPKK
jgi:hypothetical protein